MAEYAVVVSERAAREIDDLPASVAARIYAKLQALAADPRPTSPLFEVGGVRD